MLSTRGFDDRRCPKTGLPLRRFDYSSYQGDLKTALPGEAKNRGGRATPSGVGYIRNEIYYFYYYI
jgi:hypothetical protein